MILLARNLGSFLPDCTDLDPSVWDSVCGWADLGRVRSGMGTLAVQSWKVGFSWGPETAGLLSLSLL